MLRTERGRRHDGDGRQLAALTVIFMLFAAGVYLPDLGRGFIKDDFRWVLDGAEALHRPLQTFVSGWSGNFYRPLVAFSFGVDHLFYGLEARGYGFTNFALYLACTVAVYGVLRETSLPRFAAGCGTFAWATNPSGLDMAVLWLSGRTALLMTLFACASVVAMRRCHRLAGSLCYLAALLCREDALAVPLIVAAWAWLLEDERRQIFRDLCLLAVVTALYVSLRLSTDAITPATAPTFYRLTWQLSALGVNSLHYVDRAFTSTAVLALLALAAYRRMPLFASVDRRLIALAAVWFVAGLCITVRVPVRSSLYAVFPSVAAAMLYGQFIQLLRARAGIGSRDGHLLLALASILLLIPALNIRNDRWVEPARVSARVFDVLKTNAIPGWVTAVVFRDEPVPFSSFAGAFAGVEASALKVFTGRDLQGVVTAGDGEIARSGDDTLTLRLERGRVRIDSPPVPR